MTMKIDDMFLKPIDRDIQGVIKVAQTEGGGGGELVKQELEEYVVTRELSKHFSDFFSAYKRGIGGETDKMGVWVSGFFGSGKSHFLKIVSYLLENKEVGGKRAIDYFVDDNKISDQIVLADMKSCANIAGHTDVILYNIDSKSDQSGKQNKDAIVKVFLKVFNEKLGFCGSIPHLANLERNLSDNGRFEEFKKEFFKSQNKRWEDERNNFDFIQEKVVDILVKMEFMGKEAALNWCGKASGDHNISIDEFADLVKKHIDRKGGDHHVVFLVDEVGQYVGDDTKLMLNLQTVVEDLGTKCNGKAWVIVTSQQDIDSISKGMAARSNDFSKIQGRFNTRLSLSSTNVDEVIRKRILEKKPVADETLTVLYEQKETVIKNLILFSKDSAEMKLYPNAKNFVAIYPFVPYQFDLLPKVLTSIRTHGASGKHLSEGERSMLSLFKESAEKIKNKDAGELVPFNLFYDALQQFLDHSHKSVIERAYGNGRINPDNSEVCFEVDVLKALFMVKYVEEIEANLDNLTSLMVKSVDDDRIALRRETEAALKTLVGEKLVQKNGEIYIFLTDEEQGVNRAIDSQAVESAEIIEKVLGMIFDGIYSNSGKISCTINGGRYAFSYNQQVDGRSKKYNQSFPIGLNIITPDGDNRDETTIRIASRQEGVAYVLLPDDTTFFEELTSAEKINKFLITPLTGVTKAEDIKTSKGSERTLHNETARTLLTEALRNASIFVGGDKVDVQSKDVSTRLNEALEHLVDRVYNKLSHIDSPKSEEDLRSLINQHEQKELDAVGAKVQNSLAIKDVSDYMDSKSTHNKVSLKDITEHFKKPPYGFKDEDTKWIVAKLFVSGYVSLTINSDRVTLDNKKSDIVGYFKKSEYAEKLIVEKQKHAEKGHKTAVLEVLKMVFDTVPARDDDDSIRSTFIDSANKLLDEIKECQRLGDQYPGKDVLNTGKRLMNEVIQTQKISEFFITASSKKDEFLAFADDYELVKLFFAGSQKGIFDKALEIGSIYDDSRLYINNPDTEAAATAIKAILANDSPYLQIRELPGLIQRFDAGYGAILEDRKVAVKDEINNAYDKVIEELEGKAFKDEMSESVKTKFKELESEADNCKNIANMASITEKTDKLKIKLLNYIHDLDSQIKDPIHPGAAGNANESQPVKPRVRSISVRDIAERTWLIKNSSDIDMKIEALRVKLKENLEDDTILQVEF
jgi:hypothetical protein